MSRLMYKQANQVVSTWYLLDQINNFHKTIRNRRRCRGNNTVRVTMLNRLHAMRLVASPRP